MIETFPAVLNLNRLFLKLNRFICKSVPGSLPKPESNGIPGLQLPGATKMDPHEGPPTP